ncbi:MAG TPA: type II toxin-antitoxin system CcdA family antitoxin [Rhizomicrobium sp.]|jgi:antitoxin CcdA|nr:type II toxin-antitoxin system CcdA family antitoxin [Rhizomicrobium sp.]
MKNRRLEDPSRPFHGPQTPKHNRHIGPGPKPGPKRAVNVSVDAAILKVAKEMEINLSQALEDTLRKLTEPERVQRFRAENREFFESYEAYIGRNGVFGEELLDLDDPPV